MKLCAKILAQSPVFYATGVDLVHDEPEKSLITEVDLTRRCQEMARTHLNRANGQLNLNRAAQHELEKDSKDKHIASTIDRAAFNLKETSRSANQYNSKFYTS